MFSYDLKVNLKREKKTNFLLPFFRIHTSLEDLITLEPNMMKKKN